MTDQEQQRQIEETNRRFRENQTKLLSEFIGYLNNLNGNKTVFHNSTDEVIAKSQINQLLDERSKKND